MEIKLNKLVLQNFMGIRDFSLDLHGENATVLGVNGAGKSTLFSAFTYVLFGKDSQSRADFALKTLDAAGQEIHNLCHSVEGVLDIDGRPITLKKELKEKWTKKRGSPKADFTGHTTSHFVDGVPVTQREYQDKIASIIEEDTFKLLTSPSYFNSLHWAKRREILLQVCGDVADDDVIKSDILLASLPEILNGRSLDDHRKVIAAKRKEINDRLKELPSRIDELTKTLATIPTEGRSSIETRILELEQEIRTKSEDTTGASLRKEKAELEARLQEARNALEKARREAVLDGTKQVNALEDREKQLKRDLQEVTIDRLNLSSTIDRNTKEMDRLRDEYKETSAQEFKGATACPACGQNLPEDQVQAAREKHNTAKAGKLADINARGKKLKAANEENGVKESALKGKKATLEADITDLDTKLKDAQTLKDKALQDAGAKEKESIATLEADLASLKEKIAANIPPDTALLEAQVKIERAKIAQMDAAVTTEKRIQDLGIEEKKLAAEYEELERQMNLMDRFEMNRANLIESKVAGKFQIVNFKLFKKNINGGVEPCCETTVNGVPWDSINTGGQILGGLDIVQTLQNHYGIKAPCWLDHKESLTSTPEVDFQLISLVADEKYDTLTVQ